MITIEDFKKIEFTLGEILSSEKIEGTDKLLRLMVNIGESAPRQVVSGISLFFPDCSMLVGKKCMFVANLEPRTIRGFESNGMIMALSTEDGKFSLLVPENDIPAGTKAK